MVMLFMNNNRLVSLHRSLLTRKPMLQWISFGYNSLQHVGHNFLGELRDFSNNPCIDKFVYNPDAIQELNLQLPIICPPLLGEYSPGCLDHIDSFQRGVFSETDELRRITAAQNEEIPQLRNAVLSLEQQMRAMWPCVRCPSTNNLLFH